MSELDATIQAWAASLGWPGEGALRLVLAAVAGGCVGLEREMRGRQAGLRTHLLVCIGSAIAMIVSVRFAHVDWPRHAGYTIQLDPARIAYGIMTGIGFLGAGTILRDQGSIRGLTTAAGIWCVAAIGLAAGFGLYLFTLIAAALVFGVLRGLAKLEAALPRRDYRVATVRRAWSDGCVRQTLDRLAASGFDVTGWSMDRRGDRNFVDLELRVALKPDQPFADLERAIADETEWELVAVRDA